MQHVYDEVNSLDKRCYEKFFLSEDLLMEQAAFSMCSYIQNKFSKDKSILIVCGPGNNGADGIALARMLYSSYDVKLYTPYPLKTPLSKIQFSRAMSVGVESIDYLCRCDVIVDCLFGSGLNKELDEFALKIIDKLNRIDAYKLSCDIPSGIKNNGQISKKTFIADITITMGALKTSLFSDAAKDFVGEIEVANLGIQKEVYENKTNIFLLEKSDMKLPLREQKNSHKGKFGHLSVIIGEKEGAGIIASDAAFAFGAGLVTAITHKELILPYHLMQAHNLPINTSAIAIGMGLGNYEKNELNYILNLKVKKVIDADLFYNECIKDLLYKEIVLTPHPKEFVSLLKICKLADISVKDLQNNRFKYIKIFSFKYPRVTILLKGSNTLIANEQKIYINTLGTPALSKGGSGDVLTGLIASLLAQKYSCLEACITASLAHAQAACNYKNNNYSLSPEDLINEVKKL